MRTIADCTLSEFLPAAYNLRRQFHEYYHLIGMDALFRDFQQQVKAAPPEERQKFSSKYISRIFEQVMLKHPRETVGMIAAVCMVSPEEAENFPANEALGAVLACIRSEKVMDFFISLEASAGGDTAGILLTLISLKLSASEKDTSGTASGNSTETTSGSATSTGTSESASGV